MRLHLLFFILFSFVSIKIQAQSNQETPKVVLGRLCTNKSTPKSFFYADKFDNIIDYVDKAPAQLKKLKERNEAIVKRLNELKTKKLPELESNLKKMNEGNENFSVSEISISNRKIEEKDSLEKETQRKRDANSLTTKNASVSLFEERKLKLIQSRNSEIEKLQKEKKQSEEAFELALKTLRDNLRKDDEFYLSEINKIKQIYDDRIKIERQKLKNYLEGRRNPRTDPKGSIADREQTLLSDVAKLERERDLKVKEKEAEQNISSFRFGNEIDSVYSRKLNIQNDIDKKIQAVYEDLGKGLSHLDQLIVQANTQYENALKQNKDLYRQAMRQFRSSEIRRVSRLNQAIKTAKPSENNPLMQFEKVHNEIVKLEDEFDKNLNGNPSPQKRINETNQAYQQRLNDYKNSNKHFPERFLEFHGIKQIEPLLSEGGEFFHISKWWNDSGRQNFLNDQLTQAKQGLNENPTIISEEINTIQEYLVQAQEKAAESSSNTPQLDPQCVVDSTNNKDAGTHEYKCNNSNSAPQKANEECNSVRMSRYITWSTNRVMNCLSKNIDEKGKVFDDPINPNDIYLKLNNESGFKPYFCNQGGCGLVQLVRIGLNEVFGTDLDGGRASGRTNLARIMSANPQACSDFKTIFDFEKEKEFDDLERKISNAKKEEKSNLIKERNKRLSENRGLQRDLYTNDNACQMISLQKGMQVNLLGGLGLYKFYRNKAREDVKKYFGLDISQEKNSAIADLITILYYGPNGPNQKKAQTITRADGTQTKIPPGGETLLAQIAPRVKAKGKNVTYTDVYNIIAESNEYFRAMRKSLNQVFPEIGKEVEKVSCTQTTGTVEYSTPQFTPPTIPDSSPGSFRGTR